MQFNRKTQSIVGIVAVVFVAVLLVLGISSPKISITNDQIKISGELYSEKIKIEDVKEIKLLNQIPRILIRTNGFDLGEIKKGYFNLEYIGRAKLFLQSEQAPFILIEKNNEEKIFLNYNDRNKTESWYQKLREWMDGNINNNIDK